METGADGRAPKAVGRVSEPAPAVVIDLDHALLKTDTLHEAVLSFVRDQPLRILALPLWIFRPRASRADLVGAAALDVEALPVREHVTRWAAREAAAGRATVLATSGDRRIAQEMARRFPWFTDVLVFDPSAPSGAPKAATLDQRFPDGFVYAGAADADFAATWRAGDITIAGAPPAAEQAASSLQADGSRARDPGFLLTCGRALRVHQWIKNALVFVPLILGGKIGDASAWAHALVGFVALSILSSATYLLNDLWDLPEDRRHRSKHRRPLASGDLSIRSAVWMIGAGVILAFALAGRSGWPAAAMLGAYLAVTSSYSFYFRRQAILDVFVIAALFTLRLGLGVVLTDVRFSYWLFVFSMFVFLSLSLAKRYAEVSGAAGPNDLARPATMVRGYLSTDAAYLLSLGVAAMLGAVLIVVIYLIDEAFPAEFYRHPMFLWAVPALLFLWLGRIWMLSQRGELEDDPVMFALKDRVSLIYGALVSVAFVAAIV